MSPKLTVVNISVFCTMQSWHAARAANTHGSLCI